jgi:ABC-type nitrate/sulfonate/bicarbonate transport system substrate-binding protein
MLRRLVLLVASGGLCVLVGCAPTPPAASPAATSQPAASAAQAPAATQAPPGQPAAAQPAAAEAPKPFGAGAAPAAPASCNNQLRKLTIGVSVSPPNVVHTPPFVARALGYFAQRCMDVNIVQFEGGLSQTALTAVAQGAVLGPLNEAAIGGGIKGHQVWGMAPRPPQAYTVGENIKTAADLKGKRLSAAGGGVGSFNWIMGREVLKTAGLTVDDVQFISQGTAGRLPGLVSGQLDGVALHPEDVFLAEKQKPGVHVLITIADLLPLYYFNSYGASDDFIASQHDLVRDAVGALIQANRSIYQDKDKVAPIMVEATEKPREAVDFAWDQLTRQCIWSVNTGFVRERTEWSIQNSVDNGDIQSDKKPTYEQVVNPTLAQEALTMLGGPTQIGACKD